MTPPIHRLFPQKFIRFLTDQAEPPPPMSTSSPNPIPTTDSRLIRRKSTYDRTALSPFDRLPLELHAEIFGHVLPPFPHLDGTDEAPMVVARVCGTWRSLVLTTPKLWASFEVEVQDTADGDFPELLSPSTVKLLHSVQIWLERSRSHPLSIRLIHMPTTRTPNSLSAQLLAMLATHAQRWRHVELMLPSTSLSESRGLFSEEFPALKQLKIHMNGQWDGVGSANSLLAMNIPWAQLTTVDLRLDHAHLLNLDEFAGLLRGATHLVSCSFNANCIMTAESAWGRNSAQDRFYLPALERLHLVLQGGSVGVPNVQPQALSTTQSPFLRPDQSLTTFLSLFAACKLTHLHLDWLVDSTSIITALPTGGSRWEASSYSSFRSLLTTLSPTLHSLRLAYLPLGEEQLFESMAQLSDAGKVRELDLRFPIADQEQDPVTDRFLRSLTRPGASGYATQAHAERKRNAVGHCETPARVLGFAGLQTLNIHCSGERCEEKSLADFVDSRTEAAARAKGTSLTQVHFYSMYPVLVDASRHVERWANVGVDAKFESVVSL